MEDFYFPKNVKSYIYENCIEALGRLGKKYDILVCTAGTLSNNIGKIKFCEKYLPKEVGIITLERGDGAMVGKGMINADLLLDDHETNLFTNNSAHKVLFKDKGVKQWNENWKGDYVANWLEFEKYVEERL